MTGTVHQLHATGRLLNKKQLAAYLSRSPRWIELRVNEGMPSENLDRHGRRLFDLAAVEAWLAGGRPVATNTTERLAVLEAEMESLRAKVRQLERKAG